VTGIVRRRAVGADFLETNRCAGREAVLLTATVDEPYAGLP
jgi:hypothetical protein